MGVRLAVSARRVSVLALAAVLTGCAPAPPPLADAALSAGGPGDDVRVVYVAPAADSCAGSFLSGIAAYRDRLVLAEDTCTQAAGGDDSERQVRLVEASPEGVRELPLPEGVSRADSMSVLAASGDGVIFLRTIDDRLVTALWQRATDGTWALLTRPAAYDDAHAGDGGPAVGAVVAEPQAVALGTDGSIYVLEPNAVRRIDPNGVIETVAGSDRLDPPELSESLVWGSAGVGFQIPDPRPLPAVPVTATDFPLPRLTAMDVADDGTVWLASHDAILRLGTDGLIAVHADATTVVPDGPPSALVGARGSSSSITSLLVDGDSLLLTDSWSARLLRLQDQRLSLAAGRREEERLSCPRPVLDAMLSPAQVCAGTLEANPDGGLFVTQFEGALTVPENLLG